ncbi:MAG: hypothetical protein J6T70_01690 [Bacteroidales bacterium]|nr:hypothetical protein [Bacteroidales bacterium]
MKGSEYKFGSTKNPYGLKGDRLVHVDEVENGLNCGCICPTCKCALIAKQGEIRIHHFAHQCDDDSCLHLQETYFMRALEILEQAQYIKLPHYYSIESQTVKLKNIRANRYSDNIKILPEIIAETEEGMEIHLRYKRIKGRGRRMIGNEFPCLELNAEQITLENLQDFLLNSTDDKKWLANPFYDNIIEQIELDEFSQNDNKQNQYWGPTGNEIFATDFVESNYPPIINTTSNNQYLESGTIEQKRIKLLLQENEYIGKGVGYCDNCAFKTTCKYLVETFQENGRYYMICNNLDNYMAEYFKGKYLDFKPLDNYDVIEQYEAKLSIDKHFTKETIIISYTKLSKNIIVLHYDDSYTFYVTNVSFLHSKYHFSHEKTFNNIDKAEKYIEWLKKVLT